MQIYRNGLLYALSYALDCIEAELLSVKTDHGKWVAYISVLMGKEAGMTNLELLDLAACATLHDNALTQYILEERTNNGDVGKTHLENHCTLGEKNIKKFPFHTDVAGTILYHHENADGSGYFGKKGVDTPFMAQLIHLADVLDINVHFQNISSKKYQQALQFMEKKRDRFFSTEIIDLFLKAFPEEKYLSMQEESIDVLLNSEIPEQPEDISFENIKKMMDLFGKIVDYKSPFTRNHSEQIANKVWIMSDFYHYDEIQKERLYIAGALHDIGKMAVNNDVLEKTDKLSDQEFEKMKNHAWYTHFILSKIKGFEDITRYASNHHEKLNGKGYPFGLTADKLDKKDRLLACVDIYQALSEDRPYKPGMPHKKCMEIMYKMVESGFIDAEITADIDHIFSTEA